jgi:biopolymer transport protein ExbD
MPLKLQHEETPALNLTPMIDLLFLLIIFFMAAAHFGEPEQNISVAVPEVSQAGESVATSKPRIVTVFPDGRYDFDGESVVTLDDLTARLTSARSQHGGLSVVIRGDAHCAFQQVASALSACQQAGISELGITVRVAGMGGVGNSR